MKKIILSLVLCGFIGAGFAQGVKFGVTAGLNTSTVAIDPNEVDFGYKLGFQAGLVLDLGITNSFSIIPELNFSQKGAKYSESEDGVDFSWTAALNYLTLPINLAYKLDLGMDQKLMFFAGPYVGYGLSTSNKVKAAGVTVDVDEYLGDDYNFKFGSDNILKSLDYGVNFGVGYQYSKIFFKLQYNLGLANFANTDILGNDASIKNSNIAVTAGYMF
ncbi:MAG: PorT family protein [Dysgonamonadaceae bacterium]|jgi:hypothetical protein|nr:PorT family protein [Dysgonamonadaceae bacterium]